METLNERLHKILENTVTEIEEARNVSNKADGVVMLNQMLQASNMYCEFLARVNGLSANQKLSEGLSSEKGLEESPPSS
jgi:hypothetical protein